MPNNSLSDDDSPTPMPRDFQGGTSDFAIIRTLDGHRSLNPDHTMPDDAVNEHHPNAPLVGSMMDYEGDS